MEEETKKSYIIPLIIISAIVIILAVALLATKKGDTTTNEQQTALILDKYSSISNGIVKYGDALTLNGNGYIAINLMSGKYNLKYSLSQCNYPVLSYTKTSGQQSITYDPLREDAIVGADGKLQKVSLSESQKLDALLTQEIYVLETTGTEPSQHKAILQPGNLEFTVKTNSQVRMSFNAKCGDSSVALKLYKA